MHLAIRSIQAKQDTYEWDALIYPERLSMIWHKLLIFNISDIPAQLVKHVM